MKTVEAHLLAQPEVDKVSITFGSTPLRYYLASTSVGPKPNFCNILVELKDSKYTKAQEENFDAYMKANYPNAITRTSLFKLSPAVDAAIEIGFIGNNVDTLVMLTSKALEIMHRNPDLINIRNSWGNKIPVWKPIYSPERAQPLGVSRQGTHPERHKCHHLGLKSQRRPGITYPAERKYSNRLVQNKRPAHTTRIRNRHGNHQSGASSIGF